MEHTAANERLTPAPERESVRAANAGIEGLPEEPYAYTDRQIAEFLHIPLPLVQEKLRCGEIPGRKIGRYWRSPRKWFEAWLLREEGRYWQRLRQHQA